MRAGGSAPQIYGSTPTLEGVDCIHGCYGATGGTVRGPSFPQIYGSTHREGVDCIHGCYGASGETFPHWMYLPSDLWIHPP